jgi:formyl-CoA transferase
MAEVAPAGLYPCSPGGSNDYVYIYASRHAGSPQWRYLLETIGRADLIDDSRFATPESRYTNREEIDELIANWTMQHNKMEAMEILGKAGVPAGAVMSSKELINDTFLQERDMFTVMEHPVRGSVLMPGFPIKMSASHVPIKASPLLGEHTAEILSELLEMSDDEISALRATGAI